MTDKERYEKYVKEHCNNCKNRHTDLCEIKASKSSNVDARCESYEKDIAKLNKN